MSAEAEAPITQTNPTPTSTPAPTSTLPPGAIVVSADDWNSLRTVKTQFEEYQKQRQADLDAAENTRLKAMAEKEGAEKALAEQQAVWANKLTQSEQRAKATEQRMLDAEKARVIASALAGRTFSGSTPEFQASQAKQLQRLISGDLDAAIDSNGNLVVKDRATGLPAEQVLRQTLDADYSHYFAATATGGTGTGDGNRKPRDPEPAPQMTELDQIVARYKQANGPNQSRGLLPVR